MMKAIPIFVSGLLFSDCPKRTGHLCSEGKNCSDYWSLTAVQMRNWIIYCKRAVTRANQHSIP